MCNNWEFFFLLNNNVKNPLKDVAIVLFAKKKKFKKQKFESINFSPWTSNELKNEKQIDFTK